MLTAELESVGMRLNQTKPNISVKVNKSGGVLVNTTCKLTRTDEKMIKMVLSEYKIHNAHVVLRGDYSIDEFIDAIEGNRKYVKCIYVYNKIDTISLEEVNTFARRQFCTVLSCQLELGVPLFLERVWEALALVRVYTKRRGEPPDFTEPLVLTKGRYGITVRGAVTQIHRALLKDFKFAFVWGKSVKFSPQRCGLDHVLMDEDVIQIMKKSKF